MTLFGFIKTMGQKRAGEKGFTLLEMITAMFAFSIVMTIIGSLFVHALISQRRALNAERVEQNLNFVMELMTRELRVAQPTPGQGSFTTMSDTNCPLAPINILDFYNSSGEHIIYSLSGNAIHRNIDGEDSVISSAEVHFTKLQFCISGVSIVNRQPKVTILASLKSADANQQIVEDYQTTVSFRFLGI